MNQFKQVIGKLKQQQERESLEQARDKAIEAAAKFRQVAELALCAALPKLDVAHCEPADLETIHRFMEETSHLNAMADMEPLTLIRLLLESTDSPELAYINAANQARAFLEQLEIEQLRLLAVTEILKSRSRQGGIDPANVPQIKQMDAVNSQMGWILDGYPAGSMSDYLSDHYGVLPSEITREILRQQKLCELGKELANDDAQNQTSEMSGLQGSREGGRDVAVDVPLPEMSGEV